MKLYDLINLGPGERVVMKLRRHPLVFLGQAALVSLLFAIPVAAAAVIAAAYPGWLTAPAVRPALVLLGSAYYLNVWMFALAVFADYYLDVWIVTDSRIIDIRQDGMFSRTVAELEMGRIQDITSEVKGIIPSLFGFGQVHIQTAAEKERFVFEQVPRAHAVRQSLLPLIERKRHGSQPDGQALY